MAALPSALPMGFPRLKVLANCYPIIFSLICESADGIFLLKVNLSWEAGMSAGVYSPGLLTAVAQKLSPVRSLLSLARGENCIYLKCYDLQTLQPSKSLRMPTEGKRIANLEFFSLRHGQWCLVKEREDLVSHRRDLFVSESFFHLGLDLLAGWRDFVDSGEWEPNIVTKEPGYAQYYRLDQGPLAEATVNRSLPKELSPAAVIGLKSGQALPWVKYPLAKAGNEFMVHVYGYSALPNICSPTGSKQKGSLGCGFPIYDEDGVKLLAEVLPLATVPSIFMMLDLANFSWFKGAMRDGTSPEPKHIVRRVLEQSAQAIKLVRGGGHCAAARLNLTQQTVRSEIVGFLGQRSAFHDSQIAADFDCPPELFQTARELDLMD